MFGHRILSLAAAACLVASPVLAGSSPPRGDFAWSMGAGLAFCGAIMVLVAMIDCARRAPMLAIGFAVAGAIMATGGAALAQTVVTTPTPAATSTIVSLGPLWASISDIIAGTLGVVITGLLGWAAAAVNRAVGVNIEKKYQDSLHSAAMTGVTAALAAVGRKADALSIDVKSQVVADGVRWVMRSVPDAIQSLGIGPEKIATLVESKLGALQQAVPVATKPVAPAAPPTFTPGV